MLTRKRILGATIVLASLYSVSALGADGTITFNGQVTSTTCDIQSPAGGDQTVQLPTVSTSALQAAGDTTGRTAFQISLNNCDTSADGANTNGVAAYFEPGPTVDPDTGTLMNQDSTADGGAQNVNVQILGDNGQPIDVGSAVTADGHQANSQIVQFSGDAGTGAGSATLNYIAEYYATAAASAGSVTTQVQYTLIYP